jgi:hypothetical protein
MSLLLFFGEEELQRRNGDEIREGYVFLREHMWLWQPVQIETDGRRRLLLCYNAMLNLLQDN